MTDISLVVTDREGNRFSNLPEASLPHSTWQLMDTGNFDITIDPLAEGATEIALVKREIQVWFNDELVHWGVPWSVNGNSKSITFQCEGIMSLLRKRFVDRMSLDYSSIDQFSIAWDLINYAQSETVQANRDLNISAANFTTSGVPRSPRYNRDEHPNILDLLKEFATMTNGFEWSLQLDPAGAQRFWTPHYPRKGTFKPEYHMRWEVGKARNITDFTWSEDGMQITTHGYVTGGSEGEVKFEQNYEDVAASAEYDVMQSIISDGTQKDVGWLYDRAVREVEAKKKPLVQTEITSVTTEDLNLGDVVEGDWLPVKIDHGRIQADAYYRVQSVTWKPPSKKAGETLTFGFDGEAVAA